MIRSLRDEVERYGHYSLAAESMYDHPFQWGSKRTGPDLARVGGKYSDERQKQHLIDPRSVVPGSIMPPYAFLATGAVTGRMARAIAHSARQTSPMQSGFMAATARHCEIRFGMRVQALCRHGAGGSTH